MATDAERLQLMADYESLLKRMAECHITVPIVNTSAGQQSSSDGDRVLASGAGGSSSAATLTGYGPSAQGPSYVNVGINDNRNRASDEFSMSSSSLRSSPNYSDMKLVYVPISNEETFPDTKLQFLSLMQQKRLLKYLTDVAYKDPLPDDHEDAEAQIYAYNCVCKCLQMGKQFPVVRSAVMGSAYQAWELIIARFEPRSRLSALTLMDRMRSRKLKQNEDLEQYLEYITAIVNQLEGLKHRVDEMDKLLNLYAALEDSRFSNTVEMLRTDEDTTYERAVRVLRSHNQRLKLKDQPKLTENANQLKEKARYQQDAEKKNSGGRDKSRDECHHCGKKGHWKSECRKFLKERANTATGGAKAQQAAAASSVPEKSRKSEKKSV